MQRSFCESISPIFNSFENHQQQFKAVTSKFLNNINCQGGIFDGRMKIMIMAITMQRLESRLVSVVIWNVGKWLGTRQVRVDVSAVVSTTQKWTKGYLLYYINIWILSWHSVFWFSRWGFERFIHVNFSSGCCHILQNSFSYAIFDHIARISLPFKYIFFKFQLFLWVKQLTLFAQQSGVLKIKSTICNYSNLYFFKGGG